MSYITRLDRAFKDAPVLPINKNSKYVFISDCHRGIGDNKDNFLKNEDEYLAALQYYYQYGYTYIEVGDGDELWENRCLDEIMSMHSQVFSMLARFHSAKRLYMLYGNHDMVKKTSGRCFQPAFPDFKVYEGVILKADKNILVTHGHQASFLNSTLWKLSRFLVRYLWAPLEYFTFKDPTSAAKNNTVKDNIERKLNLYAIRNNSLLIAGHTHRPTLSADASPYINCGSCVHPRCITCIELCGHRMSLVRWCPSTKVDTGSNTYHTKSDGHHRSFYDKCPPEYPIFITRTVLESRDI